MNSTETAFEDFKEVRLVFKSCKDDEKYVCKPRKQIEEFLSTTQVAVTVP